MRACLPILIAAAALLPLTSASAGTVSYRLERLDIPPAPGFTRFAQPTAIDHGLIAGTIYSHDAQENVTYTAMVWAGSDHLPVLLPSGNQNALARGVSGDQVVGLLFDSPHAALWTNGGTKLIDLHPSGYKTSEARGTANGYQVGYADNDALVWHGSANDFLNLTGSLNNAQANATDGRQVIGSALADAALWTSFSSSSYVRLAPKESDESEALGVWSGYQVGWAEFTGNDGGIHAVLWHGSSDSAIDLHPDGFDESRATAINNGIIVGSGTALKDTRNEHNEALVWLDPLHGEPPVNLSRFTDGGSSNAWGIDSDGVIVGDVEGLPVRWVPISAAAVPLPPAVLSGSLLLAIAVTNVRLIRAGKA